jgi:hypothetical protein
MNIKLKYIVIALLIDIFIIAGLIWYVTEHNSVIKDRENKILVLKQNEQALNDELSMKVSVIQDFAIRVENLQKENDDIKKQYRILISNYQILWDSIKVLNAPANVDTTGNKIVITFEGKEGKIWYNGSTTYFKLTGKGVYSINVGSDPTTIVSEIYWDKENNIIRNKIYADSVLIDSAKTKIDEQIYLLIQGSTQEPICELGFFDRLRATMELNQSIHREDLIYTPAKTKLSFGAEYQFNTFRINAQYDVLNNEFDAGIKIHPSIKDIWKLIF